MSRGGSTRQWRQTREYILRRDGWACRHCGRTLHPRCLVTGCPACAHVDHVLPVALGGSDHPTNLVASCQACNLKRGARIDTHPANGAALRTSRRW